MTNDEYLSSVIDWLKDKSVIFGQEIENLDDLPDVAFKVNSIKNKEYDIDI